MASIHVLFFLGLEVNWVTNVCGCWASWFKATHLPYKTWLLSRLCHKDFALFMSPYFTLHSTDYLRILLCHIKSIYLQLKKLRLRLIAHIFYGKFSFSNFCSVWYTKFSRENVFHEIFFTFIDNFHAKQS